jgi:hypothetical protein
MLRKDKSTSLRYQPGNSLSTHALPAYPDYGACRLHRWQPFVWRLFGPVLDIHVHPGQTFQRGSCPPTVQVTNVCAGMCTIHRRNGSKHGIFVMPS